jgi:hypothetical protein
MLRITSPPQLNLSGFINLARFDGLGLRHPGSYAA